MKRRYLLQAGIAGLSMAALSRYLHANATETTSPGKRFAVTRTDADWRKRLTATQYRILRQHGTEAPFSSPLDKEKRQGIFACAGCDLPLFNAKTKFDSGTGWPSFYAPLTGAVGSSIDRTLMMVRTEVHCNRCGGHLGHVFDDGPPPTGQRFCINGVAMKFIPS
jgi:peptide-methionine (R)-S-oxide reductase